MGTPAASPPVAVDVDPAEEKLRQLIEELNPPLDEPVIRSVASDYDLPADYDELRAILLSIAETAVLEEATGFDPTGLGHQSGSDPDLDLDLGGANVDGAAATDATSLSEASSADPACFTSQTDLTEDEKVASLRVIFSHFGDHTLKFALKNAGGDVERAFDELLNRQYLQETGELAKGVDGFYAADENVRPGKAPRHRDREARSARKQQLQVDYKLRPAPTEPADDDSDHLGFSSKSSTSTPWTVPTNPVTLSQRPLASSSRPAPAQPQPTNPTSWQTVSSRPRSTRPTSPSPSSPGPPLLASTSTNAQAAAALRRKGGPLYTQAAAVYTSRWQADAATRHAASFARSLAHVAAQSSAAKVDLHGVPVLDGVRIARDRVRAWWAADLDEAERERRRARHGNALVVVTGLGNHSVSGVSRLRQAVAAMLRNDGWRFDTGTGEFHVFGRV